MAIIFHSSPVFTNVANPKFRVYMAAEITRGDPCCRLVSYIEGDEYDQKRRRDLEEICAKAKSYGCLTDSSPHGNLKEACKNK